MAKYLLVESTGHDINIHKSNEIPSLEEWVKSWLEERDEEKNSVREIKAYIREANEDDYYYIERILDDVNEFDILKIYELELDYYDEYGKYIGTFNPALFIISLE